MKWEAWYKLKCWRTVLWPNICQHVHIGIRVYVFMRALFQVISVLGIYLICWTKINAAGQTIVPQLGFNRPRWNRTDLQRNQNRNRNGACQVWILGVGLYRGKPSEGLITFRWAESSPSEDVTVFSVYYMCVLCVSVCKSLIEILFISLWPKQWDESITGEMCLRLVLLKVHFLGKKSRGTS